MNTINVYFDGGTSRIDGYGSFEVEFNGFNKKENRIPFKATEFKRKITSTVAEYLALLSALYWLRTVKNKPDYHVHIHGDCKAVIYSVQGKQNHKQLYLKALQERTKQLLFGFKWQCEYQPRKKIVSRFGH